MKSLFSPLSTTVTMYRQMSSYLSARLPTTDELCDRVVERTLALDAVLDEQAGAALVDYVRAQLAALSRCLEGRRS